jgi:predicted RNA-binding Zn-ribbon protein involved in translation (DUF1610 family)
MRYEAEVVKCDNCGNTITRKKTGVKEFDGGYTSVNIYEDIPNGWVYERIYDQLFDLCPNCAEAFKSIKGKYMTNIAEWLPGLTNKDGGRA